MFKYIIKIFLAAALITAKPLYSQNGFDSYLLKDSTYSYNSSLRALDSLFSKQTGKSVKDTSFYNTFGKAEVITLNQLLFFAVNNHPDLKTIDIKIEASDYKAEEKTYLPDPVFEFELDDIMNNFKRVGMVNFYVSQMFPFPGKLGLEKQSVLNTKAMLQSEKLDMAVNIMNMVRMNYYDLYLVNQKLKINHDNRLIIKTFVTATEAQYLVGKGMQQEVFKSQIQTSRLLNEEFILNQQRKNIFSELAKLTKTVIDENTKMSFADIDTGYLLDDNNFNISDLQAGKLVDYAFEHRADLKTLRNKIIMNNTELDIAKTSRLPDFSLRLGYKILANEDRNAFSIMLGVNIPIAPWSSGKYHNRILKSELDIKSTQDEYKSKQNEIRNEIMTIVNNIRSLKESMTYYYGVLMPQTENTLKSTQYSYENHMTGFLDLLDSYRMYQDARLMYDESVNMYLKMLAELEKATGINLKN